MVEVGDGRSNYTAPSPGQFVVIEFNDQPGEEFQFEPYNDGSGFWFEINNSTDPVYFITA